MYLHRHLLRQHAGFSYIEVMVAVVVLAACLAPALNALSSSMGAPAMVQGTASTLNCVRSLMEQVAAEPYRNLLLAAAGNTTPTPLYSLPVDAGWPTAPACPVRNVTIAMYNPTRSPAFVTADSGLLYVTVSAQESSTAPGTFSLTTMVAR